MDHDDPTMGKTTSSQWVIRIIFLLLQVSPMLRYIDTMVYGIKSKIARASGLDSRQAMLFRRMLDEDTNGALLRLFHCFLHAAPQAVLQLVILLRHVHPDRIGTIRTGERMVLYFYTAFVLFWWECSFEKQS